MKKIIGFIACVSLIGLIITRQYAQMTHTDTPINHPIVSITLSNDIQFKMMLYPEVAPNTVNNIITLINSRFYEDTWVNEINPGFLICLGDPIGDGTGYPGYYIRSECTGNNVPNTMCCTSGTVCMARGEAYNTEGSQFFILLKDATYLDGTYTAFAKVIQGMELLSKIKPDEALSIKAITVQTFGISYDEPLVHVVEDGF